MASEKPSLLSTNRPPISNIYAATYTILILETDRSLSVKICIEYLYLRCVQNYTMPRFGHDGREGYPRLTKGYNHLDNKLTCQNKIQYNESKYCHVLPYIFKKYKDLKF